MIHVESKQQPPPVPPESIERAARAALTHERARGDLSVVLTDDTQLHELNRRYLGINAPTDVLSFSSSEKDPESGATYLGDILISIPRAGAQALAAGHPLQSEVELLVVHGVLHLLGYDHAEAGEKSRMWMAQAEVLERLGVPQSVLRES
jgi:probable rRNA maturation factor